MRLLVGYPTPKEYPELRGQVYILEITCIYLSISGLLSPVQDRFFLQTTSCDSKFTDRHTSISSEAANGDSCGVVRAFIKEVFRGICQKGHLREFYYTQNDYQVNSKTISVRSFLPSIIPETFQQG